MRAHVRCRTVWSLPWKSGEVNGYCGMKVHVDVSCDCVIYPSYSLQSVTNAFSVFGCRHMLDIGFVDACIQTIFSSTAGLDCWKMRRVVRIPHLINFPFSILLHALGAGGDVCTWWERYFFSWAVCRRGYPAAGEAVSS